MTVSAIAAVARNGVIGLNDTIPWYLPADLQYFKKTTLDHHIIMGRKCLLSLGRPLPKRTNVVVTRNPFFVATGCLVVHSVEEALELALANGETEAFIIGGGEIYAQSMDLWDKLYLTRVELEPPGDTFFPAVDPADWNLVWEEMHGPDDKNEAVFAFQIFERR